MNNIFQFTLLLILIISFFLTYFFYRKKVLNIKEVILILSFLIIELLTILVVHNKQIIQEKNYITKKTTFVKIALPETVKIDESEVLVVNKQNLKIYCNYDILNNESEVTLFNCKTKNKQ